MSSRLLNTAQVAERLGISKPLVRSLWDRKVLPCVQIPTPAIGRRVRRTDSSVLENWILQNTPSAGDSGIPD